MEWIEDVQRQLGAPVVAFMSDNWGIMLVVAAVAVFWFVGDGSWHRRSGDGGLMFGDGSPCEDGDGGGDGGD